MTPRPPLPAPPRPRPPPARCGPARAESLLALVLLLAAAVVIAAVRSGAQHGRSTRAPPTRSAAAPSPNSSPTRACPRASSPPSTRPRAAAGPDTTLLVAAPDLLTRRDSRRSCTSRDGRHPADAPSSSPPGRVRRTRLVPGVTADPAPASTRPSPRTAPCPPPGARAPPTPGGIRYITPSPAPTPATPAAACPPSLRIPAAAASGDTVVLGAPDILYNDRLDKQGNASLALQLLGSRPHLVWYLPSLSDPRAPTDAGERSFFDLHPLRLALGHRCNSSSPPSWPPSGAPADSAPSSPNSSPSSIRASETTEGRARLYRKTNARDRAAAALRAATRTRLAPLVGVPADPGAHAPKPCSPPCPPGSTAGDGPGTCRPCSSARRPATTRPSSASPTNSTPSKERYALHDGPDH